MQIDVIVPTYNRASVVIRAIDSVLNQTYKNFNLIVVDDGSTDETIVLLEKYKNLPNVKILSTVNKGVSSARNFAVANSSSEWISFLDSDDEWLLQKLDVQVQFLAGRPDVRFLNNEEIWVRNGVRVNPKVKHIKSQDNIFQRSLEFCLISPSTVLMKRDLFLECGGFDESFVVCEDYDLWLKVMAKEEIAFSDTQVTIKNGGHADQLSTKFVAMDYWRIKSLVNLITHNKNLSEEKILMIKDVISKKSEILLRGYLKHQNQKSFEEISQMLTSIMLPVKY